MRGWGKNCNVVLNVNRFSGHTHYRLPREGEDPDDHRCIDGMGRALLQPKVMIESLNCWCFEVLHYPNDTLA